MLEKHSPKYPPRDKKHRQNNYSFYVLLCTLSPVHRHTIKVSSLPKQRKERANLFISEGKTSRLHFTVKSEYIINDPSSRINHTACASAQFIPEHNYYQSPAALKKSKRMSGKGVVRELFHSPNAVISQDAAPAESLRGSERKDEGHDCHLRTVVSRRGIHTRRILRHFQRRNYSYSLT